MITQSRLKALLYYDPVTGDFTNLTNRGSRALKGELAGSEQNYGYWWIYIEGRRYMAHRLAWFYMTGEWPSGDIDHINGAKGDNRFNNLRIVTRRENCLNRGVNINNYLQHKYIYPKDNKYYVQVYKDGCRKYVGRFYTMEAAIKARDLALQ